MSRRRKQPAVSRREALTIRADQQLIEEAAFAQVELDLVTSPDFAQYRQLITQFGPDTIARAVILAADLAWDDADLDSTVAQPQPPLPDAPNDDRCGPQGRALVNAMAEHIMTARETREARKAGRAR
jgi:hypothetical protein